MKPLLPLGLVLAGLATGCALETFDSHPHRVCADVEWLNGLSNPIGESYHPNELGHDAFTDLVAARL
jgi:hypothetical protein